jgi:hypothetical protein
MHARPRLGRTLITEAKVPLIIWLISTTRVHPVTIIDTVSQPHHSPFHRHCPYTWSMTSYSKNKSSTLCHHFVADLENSSGIMEQTVSSFISKCQMAAQLRRYLIIAKKRVHSRCMCILAGQEEHTPAASVCAPKGLINQRRFDHGLWFPPTLHYK